MSANASSLMFLNSCAVAGFGSNGGKSLSSVVLQLLNNNVVNNKLRLKL